jgi:two-component system sensor histidine kinase PilS (NtrC family)
MQDEPLLRSVIVLSLGRLIICTVTFIFIVTNQMKIQTEVVSPFKISLFVAIAASVFFILIAIFVNRLRPVLISQFVFDYILESFVIYITGGLISPLVFLYLVSTVLASIWLSSTAGIVYASTTTVAFATTYILYHQAATKNLVLPFVPEGIISLDTAEWLPRLVLNSGIAFVIAILSSQLARASKRLSLFYAPVLENIGEGVLALDHNGKTIFVNNELLNILGIKGPTHSFVGKPLEEILRRPEHLLLKNLLKKEDFRTTETEIISDGKRKNVEVRVSNLISGNRKHKTGKVILFIDLTLRREMEKIARHVQRLSELEEVSIGLAHELRNPLASIRGCAQQLERSDFLQPQYKGLMRIIQRESDRLNDIIDQFFHLTRPEPIVPVRTDLRLLLDETVNLLKTRQESAGVEIELKAPCVICHCDADKIKQVFLNIGINSLEALSGKGKLVIELKEIQSAEETPYQLPSLKDGVVVSFTDNGCGIRSKDLPKIFTPFFTTKPDGIGMGLAIANKIVAEHGGVITVDSSFGKGSVFKIFLPRVTRAGHSTGLPEGVSKYDR